MSPEARAALERMKRAEAEARARMAARDGLVEIGEIPIRDAEDAVGKTLRHTGRAVAVVDAFVRELKDRAYVDPAVAPGTTRVHVRDAERPEWIVPQATVTLELDCEPERVFHVAQSQPIEVPPHIREIIAAMPPPVSPQQGPTAPVVPREHRRRAMLVLSEGRSQLQYRFDDDGAGRPYARQGGGDDWWAREHGSERPYAIDTRSKPPQIPPPSFLLRGDLDPDGHSPEDFGKILAAASPERAVRWRARVPAPTPGGPWNVAATGGTTARKALWDGDDVDDEGGWLVADGWGAGVTAFGATLDEAYAAWRERVEADRPAPPDAPARHVPWPAPEPENVPCVAIPVPPRPRLPPRYDAAGFRAVRRLLSSDVGEIGHVYERKDARGTTWVGDEAAKDVDPVLLDDWMRAADEESAARMRGYPMPGWQDPFAPKGAHAWLTTEYIPWDDLGREALGALRPGMIGHGGAPQPWTQDGWAWRWRVFRTRFNR